MEAILEERTNPDGGSECAFAQPRLCLRRGYLQGFGKGRSLLIRTPRRGHGVQPAVVVSCD